MSWPTPRASTAAAGGRSEFESRRTLGVLAVGLDGQGVRRAWATARLTRRLRLLAVFDPDPTVAERVARRLGVLAVPDLDAGLGLRGIDAVLVALPTDLRAEAVLRALGAGKHVLCEAPLAVRPREAQGLARQADAAQLRLALGLVRPFDPPLRDALALVRSWDLGAIESVRVEVGHRASLRFLQSWRTDVARSGGGALMHHGPLACDLIRRVVGEVVLAKGFVRQEVRMPPGCETAAFALFRNHDNAVAELHASWTLPRSGLRLDVRGEGGFLRAETDPWRLSGRLAGGQRLHRRYGAERLAERWHRLRHGVERAIVAELDAFGGSIPEEGVATPALGGARSLAMIRAVYQSDRTGDEVILKPTFGPRAERAAG